MFTALRVGWPQRLALCSQKHVSLSGWADEFTTFTGADGQYGIHGTTDPDTIGERGGPGSIRLADADIEALVEFLPLGVPVEIV